MGVGWFSTFEGFRLQERYETMDTTWNTNIVIVCFSVGKLI